MAYNTRKMLEDSNGDLIPQYYNESADRYEDLRGQQGVQFTGNHVMTDSGIWVPQKGTPEGAAHTQVTGSIEELGTADNIVLTAGSHSYNIIRHDISNSRLFAAAREKNNSRHKFRILLGFYSQSLNTALYGFEPMKEVDNDYRAVTDHTDVMGDNVGIGLQNLSADDKVYTLALWGVR
jgi:hypothetical protein